MKNGGPQHSSDVAHTGCSTGFGRETGRAVVDRGYRGGNGFFFFFFFAGTRIRSSDVTTGHRDRPLTRRARRDLSGNDRAIPSAPGTRSSKQSNPRCRRPPARLDSLRLARERDRGPTRCDFGAWEEVTVGSDFPTGELTKK